MSTLDELIERARDLAPKLAARATLAEEQRELPTETLRDFEDAGFYRILVPRRYGGYELNFATLAGVGRELGRGCTSSAWVLTFLGLHNWLLAQLPEQAQDEVFGEAGYALAAGTFAPTGGATPVDGGYQLSGRWSWGSGVMHSTWAMVAARIDDPERPSLRLFLLPIADVEIEDIWHTSGMRATGSNDIVVRDRVVPEHRTVSFAELVNGEAPGARIHNGALYRWPLVPALALNAAVPALGTAEMIVERFRQRVTERVLAYSDGTVQQDKPAAQMRLGRAAAELLSARALFDHAVAELSRVYDNGGRLDHPSRVPYRLMAAHVVHLSRRVINSLCEASGGSAHLLDSPFQRAMRDVNTLAGHVVFDYDATTELYGRAQIGLEVPKSALV